MFLFPSEDVHARNHESFPINFRMSSVTIDDASHLAATLVQEIPADSGNFPWYMTDSVAVLEDSYSEVVVHCKNRLVVLTTQWLASYHGLVWYCRLIVKNNHRGNFLVVSSFFPYSRMKKQQGNWLSDTVNPSTHATRVNTLQLKQPICFYSVNVIDLTLNWQLFSDVGRPRSFVNVMSANSTLDPESCRHS